MSLNANVSTSSNTNTFISLEMAERMLTKFDGNKARIHEFLDNCDTVNNLINHNLKSILLQIIITKITDNARSMIRNREFQIWDDLKNYLLDTYTEKRTIGQWQLELSSCKQDYNENVLAYANKVENCYVKLINSLESNQSPAARQACVELLKSQALSVFITGLNKDLNLILKALQPKTLEDAISMAVIEEQQLKSKNEISKFQNINATNTKHCYKCNKPGHTVVNCRVRTFSGPKQNTKFCNYCKKKGHIKDECYFLKNKNNPNNFNKSNNNRFTKDSVNSNQKN
ncbi:uncharacterized protein LOC114350633 [Ostrinia furnacalis]|uniref:uncharacterized protein LOC114350633 n=1 Tax=Ostrinia furnacalis TaxID=93504 RepID=UPI00103FEDBF|nr:uncharacterized protein LOC114350633 [Ostrinia furnacalis]